MRGWLAEGGAEDGLSFATEPLRRLVHQDARRTAELIVSFRQRAGLSEDERSEVFDVLAVAGLRYSIPEALNELRAVVTAPSQHTKDLERLLFSFRGGAAWTADELPRVREQAFACVVDILKNLSEDAVATGSSIVETIATQLAFTLRDPHDKPRLEGPRLIRFFQEADQALRLLFDRVLDGWRARYALDILVVHSKVDAATAAHNTLSFLSRNPHVARHELQIDDLVTVVLAVLENSVSTDLAQRDAIEICEILLRAGHPRGVRAGPLAEALARSLGGN
jgi:hypothetical protein